MLSYFFPLFAGVLTVLSPCVLPVLPFVTAASIGKSKWGPVFLSIGLLISFVGSTLFIATTGRFIGLSPETLRIVAAIGIFLSGLVFIFPKLQEMMTLFLSRFTNKFGNNSNVNEEFSASSEIVSGLLLGLVWTPCSGPSLGTAIGLAANESNFSKSFTILLLFGVGAVIPLLAFSYGAKNLLNKSRMHLNTLSIIKKIFGILISLFGIALYFHFDKKIEIVINNILPDFWLNLISKF